jgi:hypothetical protein
MPQITFGDKDAGSEEELPGISLGTAGGVETFLVVLPSGHVVARNKAQSAPASEPTPAEGQARAPVR